MIWQEIAYFRKTRMQFSFCFQVFCNLLPNKVKTICTTHRAKIVIPVLWVVGFIPTLPSALYHVSFRKKTLFINYF